MLADAFGAQGVIYGTIEAGPNETVVRAMIYVRDELGRFIDFGDGSGSFTSGPRSVSLAISIIKLRGHHCEVNSPLGQGA